MKQLVAVTLSAMMGGPAFADMSSPVHTRVPTRTMVRLEKPIPNYRFYAGSMFLDGYVVRLRFAEDGTVVVPHLHDRMTLFAVPVTLAERFPAVETLWKELHENRPEGVHTFHYDGFFSDFSLDTHRDERLEIVIRDGPNGVEFVETHRPSSSGAYRVVLAGVCWTIVAFYLGIRWARRTKQEA